MFKNVLVFAFLIVIRTVLGQTQCESMGWVNYDGQSFSGQVTGGGTATPIQVTSFSQLKQQAESSGAKVIYIMNDMGNGYVGTTGDVINVASNKTIIGYSPGITVRCSWQIKNVSNVIVRNIICRGPGNSNSAQNWDCVNIENAKRIWFDHCTVMEGEDGNFDVVKGSDNVTVTWCKFTYVTGGDHNLSNLIGSSNDEPQSHGKLNVTYAYCWWDNVNSRCPRTRYGKIHVLNCYYNNVGDAVYAGKMSNIRVEGSYFENNVGNPTGLISTDGQAGVFVIDCNRGTTRTDGYNSPFTPPYPYEKFPLNEVKNRVTNAGCGAGPTLDSPNDCGCYLEDCNGVAGGSAYLDDCNVCVGGNTGKTACVLDCNGDENGTATIDACGVCSGGNTGVTACAGAIQGEAFCSADGFLEATNTGYVGDGYLNFDNQVGSSANWNIVAQTAGSYQIGIRYANGGGAARSMSILVNGNIQGTFNAAVTGGWTTWLIENITVNLSSGVNTLVLTATNSDGGPNIDLFSFASSALAIGSCGTDCNGVEGGAAYIDDCNVCVGGNTGKQDCTLPIQSPYNGTPHAIPGRIEAEEYDLGREGLGYHEANENGNQGNATFRGDEVDIETTGDTDGEYNIAYTLTGEWLAYTVNVAQTGLYDIDLRVARDGANGSLHIEMDGNNITGAIPVPNTGAWQTYETVTVNDINLTAGEHEMRIVFDTDYMNLNYVVFTAVIQDADNDGTPDDEDVCPNDPNKATSVGQCGCGNTEESCLDCAGIPNGTAVIDACNECTGGNTGLPTVTDPTKCVATGVEEGYLGELKIYPNPTNGTLYLPNSYNWTLFNLQGEEVLKGASKQINMSLLSEGIYFLNIEGQRMKIVKE